MCDDPIVAGVRRVREELSARFGFDVQAIFADLRSRQASLGPRLVSRKQRAEPAGPVTTAQGQRTTGDGQPTAGHGQVTRDR